MNDNKKIIEFKWFEGIKMQNIKSKFLEIAIGITIILLGVAAVIHVIAPNGLI